MKMKIIADTHIWYHIAEGKFEEGKVKALPLYLTAWNILELITSPNLKSPAERNKVLQVLKTIKNIKPNYIEYEPYSFMASEFMGIPNNNKISLSIIDDFLENRLSDSDIEEYVHYRDERVNGFKQSIDKQQKNNKTDPENIKILTDPALAVNAMAQDVIFETERVLNISRDQANIIFAKANGQNLNFFLWVRAVFCRKLQAINIIGGYQAAKNDQGDILNMVYVGSNDKYWVEEPKWVENIRDAGLSNFLFQITN